MRAIRLFVLFGVLMIAAVATACVDVEPSDPVTAATSPSPRATPTIVELTRTQSELDRETVTERSIATPILTIESPTADVPTPTIANTATPTASATPVTVPSPTSIPTALPTPTPAPYVPNYVPTLTPTPPLPTATPTATPIGFAKFTGRGSMDTTPFRSPPNLPWSVEWQSEGAGPNTLTIALMDPESKTEVNVIVDESGTGELGGVNLVIGNIGTFYLHVNGPEAGWTVWIQQN